MLQIDLGVVILDLKDLSCIGDGHEISVCHETTHLAGQYIFEAIVRPSSIEWQLKNLPGSDWTSTSIFNEQSKLKFWWHKFLCQ